MSRKIQLFWFDNRLRYLLSKMTTAGFRFDLFHPDFSSVLSNCRYINLPFGIPVVYDEVNYLLTKCGEMFFQVNSSSSFEKKLEECRKNAKAVLDIAWEKINTGHWKDVDPNWRYAFTFGSLFKALCLMLDKDGKKFDIIKTCDIGLLMGAPLMQNILSKIAFKVSSILLQERNLDISVASEIEVKKFKSFESEDLKFNLSSASINIDCFKSTYIANGVSVKLIDAINNWPALSLWNVEYILKKARFRTVPIEIGSKYTDDNWTQKLMTVEDFVDQYIKNKQKQKEIGYLAQHNLFNQIPELFDDIRIPSYIKENYGDVDVDISVYFGPGGTISPLHYDPKHNLLAQVIGKKYVRLYSKETTECLYPRHNTWLSNTSLVDVDNPDLEAFPLFKDAPYKECILEPGNLLYIPPGYWHYVRSLSVSISISFWWEIPDNL